MTWTPGPWKTSPDEMPWQLVQVYGDNPGGMGLSVWTDGYAPTMIVKKTRASDARLISLAPEMAGLLQEWVDSEGWAYGSDVLSMRVELRGRCRDLLARARGEDAPPIPEDTVQEEGTVQGPS